MLEGWRGLGFLIWGTTITDYGVGLLNVGTTVMEFGNSPRLDAHDSVVGCRWLGYHLACGYQDPKVNS